MSDRPKWNVRAERNMVREVPSPPGQFERRAKALRRAWRTMWWMVLNRREPKGSRRGYAGVALREAWCGLFTGGDHSWGPLRHEYPGALRRKRRCHFCHASLTPAEEIAANPAPVSDSVRAGKPTDEDVRRAMEVAEREGFLRNGKWLWD